MLIDILLVVLSLIAMYFSSDFMVQAAGAMAKRFNISDFIIGVTVVAFGTSAPEFISSLSAALQGSPDASVGNVVGSSVFNLGFILGLVAIFMPLTFNTLLLKRDIPFLFIIACYYSYAFSDGVLSSLEGGYMLLAFILWMVLVFVYKGTDTEAVEDDHKPLWQNICIFLAGLGVLVFSGDLLVSSAINIAKAFSVSEWIIGFTIVAIGTSLPELITSVVAAKNKYAGMSVGNLIGSDIFNQAFILSSVSLITPIASPTASKALSLMAVYVFFLFLLFFTRRKIGKTEGILILCISLLRFAYEILYHS